MIVDVQNSENEEDDQFVVEAAPPLSEVSELEVVSTLAWAFCNDTFTPAFRFMQTELPSNFSVSFLP